jgi:Uma2 family endonuclease
MASNPSTLTFTELTAMLDARPEETRRHELIDGVLHVTPSPINRHQRAVGRVFSALEDYESTHGGLVVVGGGLYYDEHNYVEPDVLFLRADHPDVESQRYTTHPPTIAVEVSSDSTRRRDLTVKRRLYERIGVGEYWFVDLRNEVLLVHRQDQGFDLPDTLGIGGVLTSPLLPGFKLPVARPLSFRD